MYLLYSILLTIGFVLFAPRLLLDALRHRKYVTGLLERLGGVLPVDTVQPIIWLHCVSVGEAQAALPLAQELTKHYPQHVLVVSTTTVTGQRHAQNIFRPLAARVFYFPVDWAWTVRRTLRRINPSLVLVMETELWPHFLRECRTRQIPVALVNGRLSERSLRRYKRASVFFKFVVNDLSLAVMQTDADARRVQALGLTVDRIRTSGNVKFDFDEPSGAAQMIEGLRHRFAFGDERPLIVAASTHRPEERILIEAFKFICEELDQALGQSKEMIEVCRPAFRRNLQCRKNLPPQGGTTNLSPGCATTLNHSPSQVLPRSLSQSLPRLLIAPRHPERFAEVAADLKASGLGWAKRSSTPTLEDKSCQVVLLDSIGELRSVYALATVVFVGGSLAPVGGHNILEPAAAGKCIITGAHTENFAEVVRAFREADALVQLPSVSFDEASRVLARELADLLANHKRRTAIGARARRVLEQNRGATRRTIELLSPLLNTIADTHDAQPKPVQITKSPSGVNVTL